LPGSELVTYFGAGDDVNELDDFRTSVRQWLSERFAERDPDQDDDRGDTIARAPDGHTAMIDGAIDLQRQLAAAGLVALALPVEYGGHGLTSGHDEIVAEELASVRAPALRPMGIAMGLVLPTIMAAGTERQKRQFLPSLVAGEALWCQLFSEPDAGSDLVSLRTRAVRDGDAWVITGQKVWSSFAAEAKYGIILARTDPQADKPHAGITMFILAMDLPGVTVRPLVDIAGGHHFNEVFLEEVVLHDDDVLGEVNRGWQVATGTLSGERSGYLGGSGHGRRMRQALVALAGSGLQHDIVHRHRVVDVAAAELILEWLAQRIHAKMVLAGNPAAGSLVKLAAGNLEQFAAEVVIDLRGPHGLAWERTDRDGNIASHGLNASRQSTIAGGTHQIQRNLVGERLLGLPREAR
jgi:alkylation response protein AidB-like acyl-CoA dehydrogenase